MCASDEFDQILNKLEKENGFANVYTKKQINKIPVDNNINNYHNFPFLRRNLRKHMNSRDNN